MYTESTRLRRFLPRARVQNQDFQGLRLHGRQSCGDFRRRFIRSARLSDGTNRVIRLGGYSAVLIGAFCFRLWSGLSIGVWQTDPRQCYLIGLKCYLTRTWPYFGADVSPHVQVPGALQGLSIALPLYLFAVPEAPVVLLNLLSFFGLCLLGWYCSRRLPDVPQWVIWAWLLTAPWTLDESTFVYNPSYVLVGSVVFFVGALETYPSLRRGLIRPQWANFMMGVGLSWVMQFHMSYVLLLPYVAASFYLQYGESHRRIGWLALSFLAGALTTGIFVLPTFVRFGWDVGPGAALGMIGFHPYNLAAHLESPFEILARFLSFASFEIAPFIGRDTAARIAFLKEYPWITAIALPLAAVGVLQPVVMVLIGVFGRQRHTPDWPAIKRLCFATLGLLYVAFALSPKRPHAHNFYIVFPVAMIFSLYCWNEYLRTTRWQLFAGLLLACGVIFDASLSFYEQAHHPWAVDRQDIMRALDQGDYRDFAERRPGSIY
jgi:hypothetical protein